MRVREDKIQRRNSISAHFILIVSVATEFIVFEDSSYFGSALTRIQTQCTTIIFD